MLLWLASALAVEITLADGALLVHEKEAELARLQLVTEPCPSTHDCETLLQQDDGTLLLREEGRINHLLRASTVWRLDPWPFRVLGREVSWPHFDVPGLRATLDHRTLVGHFDAPGTEASGVPLPIVRTTAPFGIPLGHCAVHLDASRAEALAHGVPGEAADARLSVVLVSERELWIEVRDDHLVTDAASWLFEDHVELWSAAPPGARSPGVQWAIALDGQVIDAAGSPPARPTATVVPMEGGVRLAVQLPWPSRRLTVVYSDSDDGRTQERLVATSRLQRGVTETFSPVMPLAAVTRCEPGADGALAPALIDLDLRSWTELRSTLR